MKKLMKFVLLVVMLYIFGWAASAEPRVAVMDFQAKGVAGSIAANTSELIRTELINTGKYTVIERAQMSEVLREQSFQMTGCTDVSCAVRVGKLLSARKILVGSVMQMGSNYIISGRIVDVERGIGEEAASQRARSISELDNAVRLFVSKLSGSSTGFEASTSGVRGKEYYKVPRRPIMD